MSATTPIELVHPDPPLEDLLTIDRLTDSEDPPNETTARLDAENIGANGATSEEDELPRKKGKPKPRAEDEGVAIVGPPGYETAVRIQDTQLPFANVVHIMKAALPKDGPYQKGAMIAKEAKDAMKECVSEFLAFITSEAVDKAKQERRNTIQGEDVLSALTSTGFDNYAEALKIYLARYREDVEVREQHNAAKAAKRAEAKKQTTNTAASNGSEPPARDGSL